MAAGFLTACPQVSTNPTVFLTDHVCLPILTRGIPLVIIVVEYVKVNGEAVTLTALSIFLLKIVPPETLHVEVTLRLSSTSMRNA